MSNNGINNATNGRNSANNTISTNNTATPAAHSSSTSITYKNDAKTKATPLSLPSKTVASNETVSAPLLKHLASHRRDVSSVSGQMSQAHQHSLRDVNKYRYIKTQTLLSATDSTCNEEVGGGGNRLNEDGENRTSKANNEQHTLVYYDGNLVSGSLDALIEHMVPTSDYFPEPLYIFSFLLSARLFIRPHELLAKISQTWEQQQQSQLDTALDVVDDAGHFSQMSLAALSASPLSQRKPALANNVPNEAHNMMQRTATQKSAQNCIHLLAEWIETFPYDFRDERLMQQVRILTRKCVYIDNTLGKQVSRILQLLVQRLTALEKYEEFLQSLIVADLNASQLQHYSTSASAAYAVTNTHVHNSLSKSVVAALNSHDNTVLPQHFTGGPVPASVAVSSGTDSNPSNSHDVHGIMDLCPSCAQLAHQLTAIEMERLSHIGPEEFVQAFAKEYQHSIPTTSSSSTPASNHITRSSLNDMKKTRNLESYVEWFNRLSYLTASEVVKYPKKKQRVRIIEYWIETARECFNIGNFNSLMAIIAGLNLSPISRLKKTWSKVQSAKFSVLEHQMDPTSNFNSYRSTLKAAMWRSEGATDERERIIIPFFSLFVKDLYFLNEGCSNRLPNNHINFEKCSQLAKQVMEFNEWKKVSCPFERLPNVISFLQSSPVLNENTLSMASFECEPPENTEEKGLYKTVKAESKQQLLQQLQEQQQQQHQHQQHQHHQHHHQHYHHQ